MQFKKNDFDIRKTLGRVVQSAQDAARAKKIALSVDFSADIPPCVVGDEARVERIVANLLDYAIKIVAKGGLVVSVRRDEGNKKACVLVFDIRKPDLFPEEDLMPVKDDEAGFSLTVAQKLVSAMGGDVHFLADAGAGSIFCFDLRLETEALAGAGADGQDGVAHEFEEYPSLKTLVVDDSTISIMLLEKILERHRCVVERATNGSDAVRMVMETPFDIVFMDCQMPVVNGFDATRRIREIEAVSGRHTRIVAVTANSMTGDRDECYAAGMDDYVQKPYKLDEIADILKASAAAKA